METKVRSGQPAGAWGRFSILLERVRRFSWTDLLILAGLVGVAFGLTGVAREWTGALRPVVEIDLSVGALPKYTFFSLCRGLAAYGLSLPFSLGYGYWAAKDPTAERALIPLLDILQSIPVLGFMPGLVLALVAIFPKSNIGLELAAVLMIFTGQAWNMAFSFYHSLRSLPPDLSEVATVYRFNSWKRLRWVELPFATIGLVWNSMMSMAGGWFFLMISEAFVLGEQDFRLPGLGSYMSVAVSRGDTHAMILGVVAMALMILGLDQLLWRPLVTWSQKFRLEEGGEAEQMHSWFLEWLRKSQLLAALLDRVRRLWDRQRKHGSALQKRARGTGRVVSLVVFLLLGATFLAGTVKLIGLIAAVNPRQWVHIVLAAFVTLARVLVATGLGTLWALPAGLAIGLSPRLSRLLQPIAQIVASFPAPMLFPAAVAVLKAAGVTLGAGSIVIMLLGTQWYILFNVIAGATAIPADLREAARGYRLRGWQRAWDLYFPAVFPYLVTGWITAAGGAWNASIVSEYLVFRGQVLTTFGLGAQISQAAASGQLPLLAGSVVAMSAMVVVFNRLVWKQLQTLAETRYSLSN